MITLPFAALMLAAPIVGTWLLKRAVVRLKYAEKAWRDLEFHAHSLLQDKTLPSRTGDMVEYMLMRTGNGTLTRRFLWNLISHRRRDTRQVDEVLSPLTEGQHRQFVRFIVQALLYDSLRTHVSGAVLRRFAAYWLVSAAKNRAESVSDTQVAPAIEELNRHRDLCPA